MYCVRCGVKLEEGEKFCPLCKTPVMTPDNFTDEKIRLYSDLYPDENKNRQLLGLSLTTALMIGAGLVSFAICITTTGAVGWSGYVMLSLALAWIILILPRWFNKPNPVLFAIIDFFATGGYLLYIDLSTGGNWFLSFAFPLTGIAMLLFCGVLALYRYVRGGRAFITGGFFVAMGCSTMLIEFFEHITFDTPMFKWSLFTTAFLSVIGLFFIIAGIIRPMRDYLERRFFV